jgi:undecaprenyl-diphosphatase
VLLIRRRLRLAVFVVVAMAGAAVLSGVTKTAVHRARPVVKVPIEKVAGGSFPSGHALTSFVALGLLVILLGPRLPVAWRALLTVAAALIVVAVGFSRLILGVHYLTDVLGGWLIGALWLTAIHALLRPTRTRHTSRSPNRKWRRSS